MGPKKRVREEPEEAEAGSAAARFRAMGADYAWGAGDGGAAAAAAAPGAAIMFVGQPAAGPAAQGGFGGIVRGLVAGVRRAAGIAVEPEFLREQARGRGRALRLDPERDVLGDVARQAEMAALSREGLATASGRAMNASEREARHRAFMAPLDAANARLAALEGENARRRARAFEGELAALRGVAEQGEVQARGTLGRAQAAAQAARTRALQAAESAALARHELNETIAGITHAERAMHLAHAWAVEIHPERNITEPFYSGLGMPRGELIALAAANARPMHAPFNQTALAAARGRAGAARPEREGAAAAALLEERRRLDQRIATTHARLQAQAGGPPVLPDMIPAPPTGPAAAPLAATTAPPRVEDLEGSPPGRSSSERTALLRASMMRISPLLLDVYNNTESFRLRGHIALHGQRIDQLSYDRLGSTSGNPPPPAPSGQGGS